MQHKYHLRGEINILHREIIRRGQKLFLIDKITLKEASYPTKLLILAFHEIIIVSKVISVSTFRSWYNPFTCDIIQHLSNFASE